MHWNIDRNWVGKVKDPDLLNLIKTFEVIFITEPWISAESLHLVEIPGYRLRHSLTPAHLDRHATHGGILVYVKQDLAVEWVDLEEERVEHIIWLRIKTSSGWVNLGGAYLPPADSNYLQHWREDPLDMALTGLRLAAVSGCPTTLMGDLNARVQCLADPLRNTRGSRLLAEALEAPWTLLPPPGPTFRSHLGISAVDHILYANCTVQEQLFEDPMISAHAAQLVSIRLPSAVTRGDYVALPYTSVQQALHRPSPVHPVDRAEARVLRKLATLKAQHRFPENPVVDPDVTPCALTRRNLKHLAHLSRRGQLTPLEQTEFVEQVKEAKRTYRRHRRTRQREYRDSVLQIRSPRQYWRHVLRILNTKRAQPNHAPPQETVDHFRRLLQEAPAHLNLPQPAAAATSDVMTSPFSVDEIATAISQLHESAPGEDRTSKADLLKLDPEELRILFQLVVNETQVPESWQRSIICPIPKPRSDPSIPANLRGISLQPTLRKIFSLCICNRLEPWVERVGLLPESQNGFRKGRRTGDNIFITRILHETYLLKRKPLFLVQMDLSKAYDRVDRPMMLALMESWGLRGPLMEVLKALYTNTESTLRINSRYSSFFDTAKGVMQGDPLSPLLFILYISQIELSDADDPRFSATSALISALWLVDDCNLFSTSVEGVQRKVEILLQALRRLGLSVNPSKSEWIELGLPLTNLDVIVTPSVTIRRARRIRLNGYIIDLSTSAAPAWPVTEHTNNQLAIASRVLYAIRINKRFTGVSTPAQLLQLYKSLVASHFVFAAESAPYLGTRTTRLLDTFERKCLRTITGMGPSAPIALLYHDTAVVPIHLRRLKFSVSFVHYVTTLPPTRLVRQALHQSVLNFASTAAYSNTTWFAHYWAVLDLYNFNPEPTLHKLEAQRHFDSVDYLIQRHCDSAFQSALRNPKLALLAQFASHHPFSRLFRNRKPMPYLHMDQKLATAVARLRSQTHHLVVATDHLQPDHNLRVCPLCQVKDDEEHALSLCPFFDEIRTCLFRHLGRPLRSEELLSACCSPAGPHATAYALFLYRIWRRLPERRPD